MAIEAFAQIEYTQQVIEACGETTSSMASLLDMGRVATLWSVLKQ